MSPRLFRIGLGVVSAFALALRVHALGRESFWLDEVLTISYSSLPLTHIPGALGVGSVHPPLYFLIEHFFLRAFGTSEVAVRASSVIFGTIAVALLARLGRALWDPRSGLYAAALLAVSPFHIHASQDARPYALLSVLLLLSMHAYFAAESAPADARRSRIVYVGASVAAMYTHVFGWVAVLAFGAHALLRVVVAAPKSDRRARLRRWAIDHGSIAVGALAWVPALAFQIAHPEDRWGWIPRPRSDVLLHTLYDYTLQNRAVAFGMLAIAAAGVVVALRAAEGRGNARALLFFGGFPLLLPLVISLVYRPVYLSRYTIESVLVMHLFIGLALARIGNRVASALALGGALAAALYVDVALYEKQQNEDWRGVALWLDEHAAAFPPARDLVVHYPSFIAQASARYMRVRHAEIEIPPALATGDAHYQFSPTELGVMLAPGAEWDRVFLVVRQTEWDGAERRPVPFDAAALGPLFGPRYVVRSVQPFAGASVITFERAPAVAPAGSPPARVPSGP